MTGREVLAEMIDLIDRHQPCLSTTVRDGSEYVCALPACHVDEHRDLFDRARWDR